VGNASIMKEWKSGCNHANQLLVKNFGANAEVDFDALFSDPEIDLLHPCGQYIGSKASPDND
jgi:hypothetical protein